MDLILVVMVSKVVRDVKNIPLPRPL